MKRFTKIISLILVILTLFICILTSCGDSQEKSPGNNNNNTPDPAETKIGEETGAEEIPDSTLFQDAVPELDFGGYEYRVLLGTYGRKNQELYPEEQNGDILNDTIFLRNKKIEDRFNLEFKATTVNLGELLGKLQKDVKAGNDAYDMYMQIDRDAYSSAADHLLYPVDRLQYIDLTQPYWCQLPNKQLTVGGRLYWGFSDDMLSFFESTILTYFNKKQIADLGMEDLYNLVRTGNWTQDKLLECAKAAVRDLDGDGIITEADNWGIVSDNDYICYSFWSGAGVVTVDKDENDIPYFAVPGNQKLFNIATKIISGFKTTEGLALDSSKVKLPSYGGSGVLDGNNTMARISFFRAGHGLFSISAITDMVDLRDMPDDFGVLPLPKYNAEQSQYYSRVIGGFPFVVPTTNVRPDIAGAVMEAMACSARNEIIPAYYESALKTKYSRDADTAEMLDLIFDTRMYDLGDTIWCMTIRVDYTNVFTKGEDTFMSATDKNETKYSKAIQKWVDGILGNE